MKLKNGEKLTKKVAHRVCLELWTDLAKTGGEKDDWEGWEKYGDLENDCPLCEYYHTDCSSCPIPMCMSESSYGEWDNAETTITRKKYAKLFLEELREKL